MTTHKHSKNGRKPSNGFQKGLNALSENALDSYGKVLKSVLATTDHPDCPKLLGHLRARNFALLLEWAERPAQMYHGTTLYFVEAQLKSLIKKYPFSEAEIPGINPEGAALKKFLSAEHRCKWVNRKRRLIRRRIDKYAQEWAYAREYVWKTLGETPDLPSIFAQCDFTSGASVGVHGNATNLPRKLYASDWSVSPFALPLAAPSLWSNDQIRDFILEGHVFPRKGEFVCYDKQAFEQAVLDKCVATSYNKIGFVPKTAKSARTIAVEPILNGWLQKGIDQELRGKLKRRGLDLSDQTLNRRMARSGSEGGIDPYVTLDLSSASDSIATEFVRDLLPPEWFELLDATRSHSFLLPGEVVPSRYEKFCSMGNGFCFPLQSLLFAAICYAANRMCRSPFEDDMPSRKFAWHDFSVYGDDIIIRQSSALYCIELLREVGFRVNEEKSFIVGPFRESCGADWHLGQDVRPVVFDTPLVSVTDVISLHNSTLRSPRTEAFFDSTRQVLRAMSPKKYWRPGREPGENAFSVPLDLAVTSPYVKWDKELSLWEWREIDAKPVKDDIPNGAAYYFAVLTRFLQGANPKELFTLRYTVKYSEGTVQRWYSNRHHGVEASATRDESDLSWLLRSYLPNHKKVRGFNRWRFA